MTPASSGAAACAGVLLAAGESSRMGRPKQTLDWLGEPLAVYQTRQLLEAGVGQAVVVLGHEVSTVRPLVEAVEDPRLTIVVNPDYRDGKTSSIKAGLRAVDPGAASLLLLAADQPRPAALLRRLAEAHEDQGALISIPAYRGKHGHPPIFAAALLPELLRITEEGRGVREVIQRHSGRHPRGGGRRSAGADEPEHARRLRARPRAGLVRPATGAVGVAGAALPLTRPLAMLD